MNVGSMEAFLSMKRSSENDEEVDLGLKLQNQDPSFQSHQNDTRSNGGDDAIYNDGRDSGPTFNVFTTMTSDPYHVSPSHPFFKPLGEISREEMGYPFTISQWKELERQSMIYKYMVSSLPVPPDLLYPSFSNTPTFSPVSYFLGRYGNGLNYRWLGNSKDAEPMRCRRTDGKKWRCSRDVAPNQKYCERHMHRGKPRSRKPVELVLHRHNSLSEFQINKDVNISPTKKTRMNEPNPQGFEYSFPGVLASKVSTFDHPIVSGDMPFDDSRSLVSSDEQQWQQLVQTNMANQAFQHQFPGESLNLNTHVGFDAKTDMTLLERPLIDAWSMLDTGNKDNSGMNKVSFSSSNGGNGNAIDKDMCQIHMGLRVIDPWVDSSASPGGPLAEVLRPGSVTECSNRSVLNLVTCDVGDGDFVSPPATTVSSPSGVLHKTLASLSDSSGSSSPTCPSSRANTDVPFHWLN